MKLTYSSMVAAFGGLLVAISLSSCGDKGDSESDGNNGADSERDSLKEQIIGYWTPDPDHFFEMAKANFSAEELADEAAMAEVKKANKAIATSMYVHFDGENTILYTGDSDQKNAYRITSSDAATKTLIAMVTQADGSEEEGKILVIDDNTLLMTKEGDGEDREEFKLNRISKEAFEDRPKATE